MEDALTPQHPLGVGVTPVGHTQTQTNRELSETDVNCLQAKESYRSFPGWPRGQGGRERPRLYPLVTLISSPAFQKSRSFSSRGLQSIARAWGRFRGHQPDKQVNFSRKPPYLRGAGGARPRKCGPDLSKGLGLSTSVYTWGAHTPFNTNLLN